MEILNTSETDIKPQADNRLGQLTIADGIFALILLIAGLFRLVDLGKIPLSGTEAELAWSVWRFWQPGSELLTVSSPAYFTLTSLLTQIFGFSDSTMRLVPALFGLGLVALPWLLRRQLGTIATLTLCTFLAISPLTVIVSRTVGGEAIALFAIVLLVVGMLRFQATAVTLWFYMAAAALALGSSSAPLFYSGLISLLFAWLILRLFSISLFSSEPAQPDRQTKRNALLIGLTVFVASSSFMLWYPAGFGASAQIFGEWVSQFGADNGRALAEPFMAIIRYEPGLVILGIAAIIWTLWRSQPLALAALYWFCGVLVLMLVQTGVMAHAVLLTIPGYLLLGLFTDFTLTLKNKNPSVSLGAALGLFTVLMLILVNLGRQLRVIAFNPRELQYILIILLGVVLLSTILFLLTTVDATAVAQGMFVAFLAFFLLLTWGTSWWLSHEAANDSRERWVSSGTDDDVGLLVTNLQTLSRQYTNSGAELDIASSVNTPVIQWYLRDFVNAQIGDTLPTNANNRVLITSTEASPALSEQYSGSDFRLSRSEAAPPTLPKTTQEAVDILRWWLLRDSSIAVPIEQIVLWVRADSTP